MRRCWTTILDRAGLTPTGVLLVCVSIIAAGINHGVMVGVHALHAAVKPDAADGWACAVVEHNVITTHHRRT
jgi:hypothetical protein